MSLLLKRPPGREAYPGDVFYLHSRLLERAAKLNDELGAGSLTALPIIEHRPEISQHIFLPMLFLSPMDRFSYRQSCSTVVLRPAVDSVYLYPVLVGAAQIKAMKQVSGSVQNWELAQYREMQAFANSVVIWIATTTETLAHGERLTTLLIQNQYDPMPVAHQVLSLFAAKHKIPETCQSRRCESLRKRNVEIHGKRACRYHCRNQ